MMYGGGGFGWMWIWPVLLLAGLLIIGYVVVRLTRNQPGDHDGASTARRILDERFARGEIDDDEYQKRRSLLS